MKKVLVNKENINLPIAEVLSQPDTLYELSGTHDLEGTTVTVPKGCILKFEEGSKITNGTLVLNNTQIEGAKHCIATLVSGTQYELDTDDYDLTGNDKVTLMQSIVSTATCIQLHGRLENVFDNITVNKTTTFIGNGATIVNNSLQITKAINIETNDFVRISDLNFEISLGNAIYKNAEVTDDAKLSFIISNCRFKLTSNINSSSALIKLQNSREGNITDCFFVGYSWGNNPEYRAGIGIDRVDAVNTNVNGCMFSYLNYGIKATASHITPGQYTPGDAPTELYSVFACGLSVQSAVIISSVYGVFMEGNDSFFLNNSMVDYCVYPLVLISQDGANITNNYFSTSDVIYNGGSLVYLATITVHNNLSKDSANRNQRIIIANNTIYGHRSSNNYGIDMDVESKDCTIQGNTFDFFTGYGIHLNHPNTDPDWSVEKLIIDNNRFHFADNSLVGIGGNYTGDNPVIISNNYAIERTGTNMVSAGSQYLGNYVYANNHDYMLNMPSSAEGPQVYYGKQRNSTRIKIGLTIPAGNNTLTITNPMNGNTNITVYIANNRYPICVYSISSSNIIFTKTTEEAVSFTAIIEHNFNM